ncbi:hypothetical protein BS47DRAFT_1354789 [Hydnum rufescens UP504]|uniref:Uncharacterized protein n=1 Tax=Hydnum rufescens UP504 TaxID=1448309 RepID=A0A9P6DMY8_9AGAM|nr:hypothetical protein BS47DRAFT_1354789 [Hydnum rufescens UP504]
MVNPLAHLFSSEFYQSVGPLRLSAFLPHIDQPSDFVFNHSSHLWVSAGIVLVDAQRQRAPHTEARRQMKEEISSLPKWFWRFLSRFKPHRAIAQQTEENRVVGPISTSVVASAESALRWISEVPGGDKVQVRIGGALKVVKGLIVASSHDADTLRWLEHHVHYLAELLEPFAMMHRNEISPLLQYEVLVLGRELETASLKMNPTGASDEAQRWKSLRIKPREAQCRNPLDIRVFTQDFKFALDQFRANALPLYTVSPIEAALLPLGFISNSSCALSVFIEWILKSERVIEDRIGSVRTVELYLKKRRSTPREGWSQRFILVGFENKRRIENWLKIQLSAPDLEGGVAFGTTKESLHEGLGDPANSLHLAEDMLSMTRLSRKIKDFCTRNTDPDILILLFLTLRKTYGVGEPRWH